MLTFLYRLFARIRCCRSPIGLPAGTVVLFPVRRTRLSCGLAGIVEIVRDSDSVGPDLGPADAAVAGLAAKGLASLDGDASGYAGGESAISAIESLVTAARRPESFPVQFADEVLRERFAAIAAGISTAASSG
jgi:hypothetical protein